MNRGAEKHLLFLIKETLYCHTCHFEISPFYIIINKLEMVVYLVL